MNAIPLPALLVLISLLAARDLSVLSFVAMFVSIVHWIVVWMEGGASV